MDGRGGGVESGLWKVPNYSLGLSVKKLGFFGGFLFVSPNFHAPSNRDILRNFIGEFLTLGFDVSLRVFCA